MLAVGRLAAAEDALYAAADAAPRSPAPRGALASYLASRGRFRIAEILFQEAQRFGADPVAVRRAIAAMAPYRVAMASGPVVAVPLTPNSEPQSLGSLALRATRGGEDLTAVLDVRVRGLQLGRRAVETLRLRDGYVSIWIGDRQLERVEAFVNPTATPDEVRVGLDALWPLHPQVDERAGMLTLGRAPDLAAMAGRVEQLPFLLTFPGMQLVPQVGQPPMALESPAARVLLRGTRWQIDAATATLVVER